MALPTSYSRYVDTNHEDYGKTSWNCGDTVTADKMNKIENQLFALGGYANSRHHL